MCEEEEKRVSKIKAYWWSPLHAPKLLAPEVLDNPLVWVRLFGRTGRLFKNFGDEMNRSVLQYVTGRDVVWAPSNRAEVVAIGSILDLYLKNPGNAAVWGTGLRALPIPGSEARMRSELRTILAVRGPRTADALGVDPSVPIGDPGLLAPALIDRTLVQRTSQVMFVPHFRVWHTREGRAELAAARRRGIEIVPPNLHPVEVVRRLASARFVLSSSLHGVIVSHALGVPAQLISVNDGGTEPGFKFQDYFESVGASEGALPMPKDASALERIFAVREAEAPAIERAGARLAEGLMVAGQALK
ncbi:hypothetical protein PlfCFBP13513_16140 [Plantibacter flavus]|nr:hypothetical protein PlfCFBP13513_16140 [Plantibacter flavus]